MGVIQKLDPQAKLVTRGDLVIVPHLWGKDDVFSVHPRSQTLPTVVDFSAITKSKKGVLKFGFHAALTGHPAAVIKVDGKQTQRIAVDGNDWKEATVSFDHNSVVVEATATGWWNEHVVMTYSVSAGSSASFSSPGKLAKDGADSSTGIGTILLQRMLARPDAKPK